MFRPTIADLIKDGYLLPVTAEYRHVTDTGREHPVPRSLQWPPEHPVNRYHHSAVTWTDFDSLEEMIGARLAEAAPPLGSIGPADGPLNRAVDMALNVSARIGCPAEVVRTLYANRSTKPREVVLLAAMLTARLVEANRGDEVEPILNALAAKADIPL